MGATIQGKDIIQAFPEVFTNKLGKLNDFKHQIVLCRGCLPKVHKVRNFPMYVRDEVKSEFKKTGGCQCY